MSNAKVYARIEGAGLFLIVAVDASGNFTIGSTTPAFSGSAVPVLTEIDTDQVSLLITRDSAGIYTSTLDRPSSTRGNVPIIGYASGNITSILINTTSGAITAGAFSTTLSNLLGGGGFLPNFNAGLAAVTANTGNLRIWLMGDSTTAGWGGAGIAAQTNSIAYSFARKFMAYFPYGSDSSWFADKNTLIGSGGTVPLNVFDARVALGSWVQTLGGRATISGPMLTCTAGASPLALTTRNAVDTVEIYTEQDAAFGSFNVNMNGGANTLIDQALTPGTVKKTVITGPLAITTINLTRAAGNCSLVGVIAYNSIRKESTIINLGFSGSTSNDWMSITGPQSPVNMLTVLQPHLVIINLTINAWALLQGLAQFTSQHQTFITACKSVGIDVMLVSGAPSSTTVASVAVQQQYIGAYAALALANNIPFVSLTDTYVSYAVANAAGQMYDTLHPNNAGYGVCSAPICAGMQYTQIYSTEAQAVFAAFTTPPSVTTKAIYNYSIDQFKLTNIWSDFDIMYFEAAQDAQAAAINLKSPGVFTLLQINSPTFTANQGWAGNATTSYNRTQYTPSVDGVKYTLNSASMWHWNRTNTQQVGSDAGNSTTAPLALLRTRSTSDTANIRINDNTDLTLSSVTNAVGLYGAQRLGAGNRQMWKGAAIAIADTQASTGVPTQEQWIGATNSANFSSHQHAFSAWGASQAGRELPLFNIVLNHLQYLGAF